MKPATSSPDAAARVPWWRWLVLLAVAICAVALYRYFELDKLMSLQTLKLRRAEWQAIYAQYPIGMLAIGFAFYLLVALLNLPGAGVLMLAAGAVFGLGPGTAIVSFASTLGATLTFLVARYLLRDAVQARWGHRLAPFNAGVERDGAWYVFTMRLAHLPYLVVNLLAALTPISWWRFCWASQLGMLPINLIYVNAGTRLGNLERMADVLSFAFIGSLLVLVVFAFGMRWMLQRLKTVKTSGWRAPRDRPAAE